VSVARRSGQALFAVAAVVALLSIPAHAATSVLLGDQAIESGIDSNAAGHAEAFRVTATATGTLSSLAVYVDSSSTATSVVAGVYANSGSHPGTLLAQGTVASPVGGTWNTISLPPAAVVSGTTYWIALLGPVGTFRFRDRYCGCGTASETSAQTTLTTLPATWTSGASYADGPVSAYASGSGATQPILSVSPPGLSFTATQGNGDPTAASLWVTNAGGGTLSFTAGADQTWLSVTPTSGTAPQTLSVTASITGLAVGTYTGNVTVTASGAQGSPATVPVTLTVSSGGTSDWLTIDHDPGRSGEATGESTISPSTAPNLALSWSTGVDGKVTAQPLYAKGVLVAGQTHNTLVVATSANSVYALDADTGAVLWRRNLGSDTLNCSIPGGFGVTGAPVIDRANARVYAVADDGSLRTLALKDGADAAPAVPVIPNAATNKVWGGLNLVGSSLYVATASDGCDTPPWRGQVYRIDVSGATPQVVSSWAVVPGIPPPDGGGGIWGYGGVSVDPATGRVFAASGADSNESYEQYADRMIVLDGALNLLGSYAPFHPSSFPCNGAPCDVDFGATPLVFTPAGCPTLTAAGNKNGNLYLLRADDLAASPAATLETLQLNTTNDWLGSGGVGGVPAYWSGGRMVFVTDAGGGVPGIAAGIVGLKVQADCTLQVAWSAPVGGNAQPNSTPTVANGVVFVGEGNGGRVDAYDAATGTKLWDSGSAAGGSTYAAPTVADGKLFVGSWNGGGASDLGTVRAFAPVAPTPLGVTVTAPADGSTVSGPVTVTATTTGPAVAVQFLLDGANLDAEDTASPWSVSWDTTTAPDGAHILTARVRDAANNTVTSTQVHVTVRNTSSGTLLLGDQTLYTGVDQNSAGTAEAFRTTATASALLAKLLVYVDSTSTATSMIVGVYASNGSHPGTLLAQGTATAPVRGAWNTIPVPAAAVTAGTTYWIALLAPSGTLRFRDCSCANPSETSSARTLTSLPTTWTTGTVYADAPASAYGTS
jgi:outer membrane protein assembly factor BamB